MAKKKTQAKSRMLKALKEAARVASVIIDGDEARRIITERAGRYIANPDPRYRFLSGDYYDVDHAAFLRTKKTLLRLERLLPFPCNVSLWLLLEEPPDHVTVVVQNGSLHRYWRWAEEKRRMEPEMAECVRKVAVTVAPPAHSSRTLTVLAPVRDSLGDVVGLAELTAKDPSSKSLAPAWS